MGILALIGAIYIIYKLIAEACEKPYPPGSTDNWRAYSRDIDKVSMGEMTWKELDRNTYAGKYRK